MECRRVQFWVLYFTCYIQPTFQPYSPNTPQLVASMLMMCKRSSMVHHLISLVLLVALMLSLEIFTLTFSEHVANLTRSSYFHLGRLRAISLLSWLYLYCSCICLLWNRLLQCSPGWSSKGSSFSSSVCSKRCCYTDCPTSPYVPHLCPRF